jgi:competence transcription factor ComK
MLDVEVLYLLKDSYSTNIVKIREEIIVNDTINFIINQTCLKFLTTIEGRIEAIKQVYKISKFVPIYITDGLILQPIYSNKSWKQIYINISNIKKVNKVNDHTVITFINEKTIYLDISYERMKRYLKKCLKIKDNQNNKMKEEKYYG